jgi:hypothetical protein
MVFYDGVDVHIKKKADPYTSLASTGIQNQNQDWIL